MEHFVARQPIFDLQQNVFAYELLFRAGLDNYFENMDGDEATRQVLANTFLLFGINNLTEGKKAFINFTRTVLLNEYALMLPNQITVIEILEDVEPDRNVLEACRKLKKHGYTLALDDFVYHPKFQPLLGLADIVKVDFLLSGPEDRKKLADDFRPKGIRLLAEKVETVEDFHQARDWGYTLFQGYFFSRPVILSQKDVPGFKFSLLRMLQEVNRDEINFERLTQMVSNEVAVSYKLLKLANSAAFGLSSQVTSIKQALGFLGEHGIRRWVNLLSLTSLGDDKPRELLVASLTRARFAEGLAALVGRPARAHDFFLMGLFSLLDALVGRPLAELLRDIPLKRDIAAALLGSGPLRTVPQLMAAFEKGNWPRISQLAKAEELNEADLSELYIKALQFPAQALSAQQ